MNFRYLLVAGIIFSELTASSRFERHIGPVFYIDGERVGMHDYYMRCPMVTLTHWSNLQQAYMSQINGVDVLDDEYDKAKYYMVLRYSKGDPCAPKEESPYSHQEKFP